ncbi:MAG TPA: hypothetical protein PKH93_07570 [Chitinophagales bacterium]|nr:hypothetical protein [Chitinophagales bacterium]
MRIATTAVINTLQGGVDYSNGGFYWDGTDILYIPSAQKNRYASQGVYVPISQEAGVCIFENNSYIYLEKKNGCATEAVYKSIWYKVDGIKLTGQTH